MPTYVEQLLAFTNSVDAEEQTDDLTTPLELTGWLQQHALVTRRTPASSADLELARALRDALRTAMRAHHDGDRDTAALDRLAGRLPLRLEHAEGVPALGPVEDGVTGALSRLAIAVLDATAHDDWRRLKICAFDSCQWAFYDRSKNRSRTWCEWGCGNRVKTRNYRARRKADSGSAAGR